MASEAVDLLSSRYQGFPEPNLVYYYGQDDEGHSTRAGSRQQLLGRRSVALRDSVEAQNFPGS